MAVSRDASRRIGWCRAWRGDRRLAGDASRRIPAHRGRSVGWGRSPAARQSGRDVGPGRVPSPDRRVPMHQSASPGGPGTPEPPQPGSADAATGITGHTAPGGVRSPGPTEPRCHNGRAMTTETDRPSGTSHTKTDTKAESGPGSGTVATPSTRAPNSWGLGDGQAIPWEYAPAPESRDIVTAEAALRAVHRRQGGAGVGRRPRSRRSTRRPRSRSPRSRGRPRRTSTRRSGRPAGRPARAGASCPAASGPSTCSGSPGSSRSAAASSPCSRAWTRASRSRRAATSTSRSRPPTSGTTPAGRTSSTTRSPAGSPDRSAWPPRSSRGTSRCSCSPGRSPRRWPPATRSSSSRPARRR